MHWSTLTRLSSTEVGAASIKGTATGSDQMKKLTSSHQANTAQLPPITNPGAWVINASRQPVSSVRFCPAQLRETFNKDAMTNRLWASTHPGVHNAANLTVKRGMVSESKAVLEIQFCALLDFLTRLPKGYDVVVAL